MCRHGGNGTVCRTNVRAEIGRSHDVEDDAEAAGKEEERVEPYSLVEKHDPYATEERSPGLWISFGQLGGHAATGHKAYQQ